MKFHRPLSVFDSLPNVQASSTVVSAWGVPLFVQESCDRVLARHKRLTNPSSAYQTACCNLYSCFSRFCAGQLLVAQSFTALGSVDRSQGRRDDAETLGNAHG
uniref:Uncharacterized protein n=1 Tax=Rhodosorus marinus TaxID=101924 RepID=A0A7S2ZT75_9RHOD